MTFIKAYNRLSFPLQLVTRDAIIFDCGWSRGTFYNKLNSHTKIKKPEHAVIEKHFAKHNVDAWTGDVISEN